MNYTKEQFEKLPKWAKIEINRLEGNVAHFKEKASQISGESETNTYLVSGRDNTPLPKNARVKFHTDEGSVTVNVGESGGVEVYSSSDRRMAVFPCVSNAVYIAFVKDPRRP